MSARGRGSAVARPSGLLYTRKSLKFAGAFALEFFAESVERTVAFVRTTVLYICHLPSRFGGWGEATFGWPQLFLDLFPDRGSRDASPCGWHCVRELRRQQV